MEVSLETINGKKCTVIRRPFDAEWVRGQLNMEIPVHAESLSGGRHSIVYYDEQMRSFNSKGFHAVVSAWKHTIVILPALPRHPKPEDAPLLYRYMAEGLTIHLESVGQEYHFVGMDGHNFCVQKGSYQSGCLRPWLTHATHKGQRVEVAIEGD